MSDDDKALLVAAAEAAGIPVNFKDTSATSRRIDFWIEPDGPYWNPLEDDGDAFRLAVTLRIKHFINEPCVYAGRAENDGIVSVWEEFTEDPLPATRRAIVRAAAAIRGERKGT